MGAGRFDASTWSSFSTTRSYATKSRAEIFSSRSMDPGLNPSGFEFRESRDSADNPNSTAIIIAQDVTGSMGIISEVLARKGIPTLLTEIYDRKPVTDPHVMCMAIGDVECDKFPLQATQFEADIRISEQLEKICLEGGGGGNNYESYALAWYFAAHKTDIDCFNKRGKKGFLFTIGDELPTPRLTAEHIERHLGIRPEKNVNMDELLTELTRKYEVFHIIVEEGSFARSHKDEVRSAWLDKLGERAIRLSDHTKLAEVIVSTLEVVGGKDLDDVVKSWDGTTALVVDNAIRSLSKVSTSSGVVTL